MQLEKCVAVTLAVLLLGWNSVLGNFTDPTTTPVEDDSPTTGVDPRTMVLTNKEETGVPTPSATPLPNVTHGSLHTSSFTNVTTRKQEEDVELDDMTLYVNFNFYFNFLVQTLVRIFGIIGNIFNMLILSKPAFQTSSSHNILLLSLAVADIGNLIIGLPFNIWNIENSMFFNKPISFEWQVYIYYVLFTISYMFISAGNWTTTAISIHRYIAVCMPLKCNELCSNKRTRIITAVIWLISIVVFTENYLNYSVDYILDGNSTRAVFVKGILRWPLYDIITNNVQIAFCSYIPWFISFCVIIRIGVELKCKRKDDVMRTNQERGSQETRITAMLTSIVFVYLLCSIPTSVRYIVRTIMTIPVYYSKGIDYQVFDGFANFCIAFNSAINIVLYSATNPRYRNAFVEIICPCSGNTNADNKNSGPNRKGNAAMCINQDLSASSKSVASYVGTSSTVLSSDALSTNGHI
ncbi:unnamed protein product [Owenia fusiformis]|uniref:Uncharacterized protein n=1 Tax=Owenia fusiformis TaxID=6347 RepID=A0A8J1TF38_OWEFU|nr:unnamed protein product [Owenia fusiformis]